MASVFCYVLETKPTMARTAKKPARPIKGGHKAVDADKTRLRRFLFFWTPIIAIVLIGLYATALDPAKPTGRTMEATVTGKVRAAAGQSAASASYKIKLQNGEETVLFIPEKQVPSPSGRIVVEEHTTTFLKKKTYRYLRTLPPGE
jgi:hypothetical protein